MFLSCRWINFSLIYSLFFLNHCFCISSTSLSCSILPIIYSHASKTFHLLRLLLSHSIILGLTTIESFLAGSWFIAFHSYMFGSFFELGSLNDLVRFPAISSKNWGSESAISPMASSSASSKCWLALNCS